MTRHREDPDHQIRAWERVREERVYRVMDGGLEFSGKTVGYQSEHQYMFYCICDRDRHYRTKESAMGHLREAGAV